MRQLGMDNQEKHVTQGRRNRTETKTKTKKKPHTHTTHNTPTKNEQHCSQQKQSG